MIPTASRDRKSEWSYPRFMDMLLPEDREYLLSRSVTKSFLKSQSIFVQGDTLKNIFIVLKGIVKVHYLQHDGSSLTTSYCRDGMLIGGHECTGWDGHHGWSVQALVDTEVLIVDREQLVRLTEHSVHALRCVLAVSEFKVGQLKRVIQILAEATLERRIDLALRHLAELYGVDRGHEIEIEMDGRLTHSEIAEMVGASRQSVTTLLIRLARSGEIRRVGRRLFIPADRADRRCRPSASKN